VAGWLAGKVRTAADRVGGWLADKFRAFSGAIRAAAGRAERPAEARIRFVGEESRDIPPVIYRGGSRTDHALTDAGPGLSFRDSLSNPVTDDVLKGGEKYFAVDTAKLSAGSVVHDNRPPGHVTVYGLPPSVIRDAIIDAMSGRIPRR
jgi:hypothetical protein